MDEEENQEEATEETEGTDDTPELFDYADMLEAAVAAVADFTGVRPDTEGEEPQTQAEAIEAFVRDNVAQRADGELVWLGPVHEAQEEQEEDEEEEEEEEQQQRPPRNQRRRPRQSATQRALTEGDPNLPRHINRRLRNPVGNGSPVRDYDPHRLPDDKYREELYGELSKVPMGELRDALGQRTADMWDSREFDGVQEQVVKGDLLSA